MDARLPFNGSLRLRIAAPVKLPRQILIIKVTRVDIRLLSEVPLENWPQAVVSFQNGDKANLLVEPLSPSEH